MRDYFNLRKWIHIVTNPATDGLAYMLHIFKSFDYALIINTKEKGTTQAICEGAYALQPTFRFLLFKRNLEIVCSTFAYKIIYFHLSSCPADLCFVVELPSAGIYW